MRIRAATPASAGGPAGGLPRRTAGRTAPQPTVAVMEAPAAVLEMSRPADMLAPGQPTVLPVTATKDTDPRPRPSEKNGHNDRQYVQLALPAFVRDSVNAELGDPLYPCGPAPR